MLHEGIQGVLDVRRIGIAMADHVEPYGPEVLRVALEVARERFGVSTGTVKKNHRFAEAGLNRARAYALHVPEALLKWYTAQICPNAHLLYPFSWCLDWCTERARLRLRAMLETTLDRPAASRLMAALDRNRRDARWGPAPGIRRFLRLRQDSRRPRPHLRKLLHSVAVFHGDAIRVVGIQKYAVRRRMATGAENDRRPVALKAPQPFPNVIDFTHHEIDMVQAAKGAPADRQRVVKGVRETSHEGDAIADHIGRPEIQLSEKEVDRFLVLRRRKDEMPQPLNFRNARRERQAPVLMHVKFQTRPCEGLDETIGTTLVQLRAFLDSNGSEREVQPSGKRLHLFQIGFTLQLPTDAPEAFVCGGIQHDVV